MTDPAILRELFEACKSGDLVKVKKLLTPHNVNEIGEFYEGSTRFFINHFILDMAGRRSSALHFASGYGRKDVVEHLLANGANFLRDDGGLNPCHK